ncbi:TIGR02594 family protein [Enterobacter sp. Bisph1]|uniref:TIGR02594 family protein n=1 Tax=Enterobacter sp. Bisph1 TaxID=1274399 RepID=UPI00057BD23C|nr:TIGR02594 family protein [Enterobacter sp. Bisph1]
MDIEPKWLNEARKYLNEKEIKGPVHNPNIVQFWRDIKRSGIKDDETPWCAAFVGAMLERTGIRSTRFESARSYTHWGKQIAEPAYGCIVVLSRNGGGHVGFAIGETPDGDLVLLGGNQSDAVNYRAFSRARVIAYCWPENENIDTRPLPIINITRSTREN